MISLDNPPDCEECNCPMHPYFEAADTGHDGWRCPECGWSIDVPPNVMQVGNRFVEKGRLTRVVKSNIKTL